MTATSRGAETGVSTRFDIERDINGMSAAERLAVRQEKSKPLIAEMEEWLR